ncbi:hypothetical protein G7085_17790 [Tessaracoccus sp. HDW20]|nr:hypothetical protein [Tessaracoccus coleopterorum]
MSASGGVYATAPADEIIADHGTLVGSIGVIMGPFTHYDGVTATGSTLLEQGSPPPAGSRATTSRQAQARTSATRSAPSPRRNGRTTRRASMPSMRSSSPMCRSTVTSPRPRSGRARCADLRPDAASANGLIDAVMGRDEFFRHAAEAAGLDPDDTAVEAAMAEVGWASLLGISQALPVGMAPAVEQGPGITPVLNAGICSGTRPLVYAGDIGAVCG